VSANTFAASGSALPIGTLKADPKNARRIDEAALRGLQASVETFGDLSGIVLNTRSGHLVCGHQRVRALAAAGAATWTREGDAGWVEHPETHERFAVRLVDWDDTTERLANLTANNPNIQGEFTAEVLEQLREVEDDARYADVELASLEKTLAIAWEDAEAEATSSAEQKDFVEPPLGIMIECESESQQRELLERFDSEGLKCRALI
jgi:hypothetical protein